MTHDDLVNILTTLEPHAAKPFVDEWFIDCGPTAASKNVKLINITYDIMFNYVKKKSTPAFDKSDMTLNKMIRCLCSMMSGAALVAFFQAFCTSKKFREIAVKTMLELDQDDSIIKTCLYQLHIATKDMILANCRAVNKQEFTELLKEFQINGPAILRSI